MCEAYRNEERKVFDWNEAARILRETGAMNAWAGLHSDWEFTSAQILENGKIKYKIPYGASTWDIPVLRTEFGIYPCFLMESETDWCECTIWPESAISIYRGFDDDIV